MLRLPLYIIAVASFYLSLSLRVRHSMSLHATTRSAPDDAVVKPDGDAPEVPLVPKDEKPPAIGSKKNKIRWVANSNKNYFALAKSIYGPLDALAAECKVGAEDRCWPVMLSYKPENDRCTVCPCPES
mgnify:CR=1 FL=1